MKYGNVVIIRDVHIKILLIVIMLFSCVAKSFPHIEFLRQQKLKKWIIPAANYSGITPIGGNRYAIVSDNQDEDGFYEFYIRQNEISGKVEQVELIAFHGNQNPPRDAECITFFPDRSTDFISAEDDQVIAEYTLDGRRTGRTLDVPGEYSADSIYTNYGFEALSFSNETSLFWTCTENSLRKDGPLSTPANPVPARLRLQSFNKELRPYSQCFYITDMPQVKKKYKRIVAGVPEILALPDGSLLVLERDVMTTASNIGDRVESRIYLFSPVDSVKTLQAQFSTRLNLTKRNLANYEGMCFGAKLKDGRQTVLIVSDAQNGAGNVVYHLKDYIRVGIVNTRQVAGTSSPDNGCNNGLVAADTLF